MSDIATAADSVRLGSVCSATPFAIFGRRLVPVVVMTPGLGLKLRALVVMVLVGLASSRSFAAAGFPSATRSRWCWAACQG